MALSTRALALLLLTASATAKRENAAVSVNPMRRVISMLQMMQKKVTQEGKKEAELHERFQCYCSSGSGDLGKSITAAEAKIPQVESGLGKAEAQKQQLEAELSQHEANRKEGKAALAEAAAIREKEAAAYSKDSSDAKTNIAALAKAVAALEKGVVGSFLQSSVALTVRRLAIDVEMSAGDRDVLTSFLAQGEGYTPRSGQIVGIIEQMKETMEKGLADITAAEEKAATDFDALAAAKTKEVKSNTAAIESKLGRVGQVGVEIENLKEDLDDTTKAMMEDKKFLADLTQGCATKKAEWEERSKTRSEELVAIADTIRILSDDESLELFKSTLPSPALLQTQVTDKQIRRLALAALKSGSRRHGRGDFGVDLIAMAIRGHAGSFDKVVKMIDNMLDVLGKEQAADDQKKAYCESEMDKSEDEKKALDLRASDLGKAIDEADGNIAALAEEVAALKDGIAALDRQVSEATGMRKKEHAEYTETMAANGAAKKLIDVAINRLAKFYTPKLYKAPPKRELSAEDRIVANMGGEVAPTPAPGGIAGTGVVYLESAPVLAQVSAHGGAAGGGQGAPPPPPETWDAYQAKGEEHKGVVALLNMLKADLDKEIQQMTVDEKDAQGEYETFMADSAAKRTLDSKSITEKEGAKADAEASMQQMKSQKKDTSKEAMAKAEYIRDLHLSCDWLLGNFEVRKEGRAGEVDSLKNAKAVLAGADYSLVQTALTSGRSHLRGGM